MSDMQIIRKPKQPKGNHDMTIKPGMKIFATKTNYPSGVPNGTIMTVTSDDGDGHVHATVDGGDGFPWFMHYGTYEPPVVPAADTPACEAPKLWRDMTPAEKGALLLEDHDGKAMQAWVHDDRWEEKRNGFPYHDRKAYRIKPEPKIQPREFFTDGDWVCLFREESDTHRITFNLIDGQLDCASIRMEAL